jgi:hypothetical protein
MFGANTPDTTCSGCGGSKPANATKCTSCLNKR